MVMGELLNISHFQYRKIRIDKYIIHSATTYLHDWYCLTEYFLCIQDIFEFLI